MWNDLGATLKDAAGNVDTTMLGEQVTVIREQSGRFMEDVSRSVQQLNISLPSAENIDLGKSAQAITSSTKDFLDKASQSLEQGRKEALEIFVDADESTNGSGQNSTSNMGSTNGTDPTAANKNIESGTVEGASLGKDSKQGYAPWDVAALPDGEKPYADALRTEMLKLVVDAIYSRKKRTSLFLSDVARKRGYEFDLERRSGEALAALEADKNMRRLRAGLVPGKMKEDVFWQTYFYHVHRIRQTLVANEGVMPETLPEDEEDEDDLFGEENEKADTEVESGKTESANDPKPDKSIPEGPGEKSEAVSADVKKTDENTAGADEEGERDWDEELDAAFG